MTDAELVGRALAIDRDAFGALAERHRPMARRIAMGIVRDVETAREMASEAILQAYLSLGQLQDFERFQSWLHGIVLNVCRAHLRDLGRAPLSLEEIMGGLRFEAIPMGSIEPDPQEAAEAKELHRMVLDAVEALPPKSRAATLLYYYDQLTVREVAATLGVSVSAVKIRLHSARGRLRETLLPTHEAPGRPEKKREERTMIKVEIADVIEKKTQGDSAGQDSLWNILVLLDREGRRLLPLWIGPPEGRAIVLALKQVATPRPLTYSFVGRILDAAVATVTDVRIHKLTDDTLTFLALISIRTGDRVREVDARPSDAVALAAHTGSPIFVAEEVLDKGGVRIPESVDLLKLDSGRLDRQAAELVESFEREHGKFKEMKPPVRQEATDAGRELIESLFGDPGPGEGSSPGSPQ
jgi:RNA polymerase sigma factor (sigma-70 family)